MIFFSDGQTEPAQRERQGADIQPIGSGQQNPFAAFCFSALAVSEFSIFFVSDIDVNDLENDRVEERRAGVPCILRAQRFFLVSNEKK